MVGNFILFFIFFHPLSQYHIWISFFPVLYLFFPPLFWVFVFLFLFRKNKFFIFLATSSKNLHCFCSYCCCNCKYILMKSRWFHSHSYFIIINTYFKASYWFWQAHTFPFVIKLQIKFLPFLVKTFKKPKKTSNKQNPTCWDPETCESSLSNPTSVSSALLSFPRHLLSLTPVWIPFSFTDCFLFSFSFSLSPLR